MVFLLSALALALDGPATLASYEAVRVPLAQDRLDDARSGATALASTADPPVAAAAREVAASTDVAHARLAFGNLSRAVVIALDAGGVPDGVKAYRCPMTDAWPFWLQASAGMANPYMGTAMPTCGEGTSFKAAVKAAKAAP
jgi:hypothetical protein